MQEPTTKLRTTKAIFKELSFKLIQLDVRVMKGFGMSNSHISRQLGLPESTVRSLSQD